MAGWDDPAGRIRELETEVERLRAMRQRIVDVITEWDTLSKGETPTTRRIRACLADS